MCSGNCCIKDLRYENGKLQMLKGNVWSNVPGTLPTTGAPNLPPENPEITPTQSNACSKANAIWDAIERVVDAIFVAWDDSVLAPNLKSYNNMGNQNPQIQLDNWNHFLFWQEWVSENHEVLEADWTGTKAEMKGNFICEAQDEFSKEQDFPESDLDYVRDFDFVHITGSLGEFLNDAKGIIEGNYFTEQATYYVHTELGTCDCVGNGANPAPFPPAEGCVKIYPGEIVHALHDGSIAGNVTPNEIRAAALEVYGVKLSETSYRSGAGVDNGEGSVITGIGVLFEVPPDTALDRIRVAWSGVASQSDTNWKPRVFGALEADSNFGVISSENINTGTNVANVYDVTFNPDEWKFIYIDIRAQVDDEDTPALINVGITFDISGYPTVTPVVFSAIPGMEYCA